MLAASVFGKIWKTDPAYPNWDSSVSFPCGSVLFKILLTDANDQELPFMKGSPCWRAVSSTYSQTLKSVTNMCLLFLIKLIARQPDNPEDRIEGTVRFIQLDIATKDDRAENGWIYGSFIYDGRCVVSVV